MKKTSAPEITVKGNLLIFVDSHQGLFASQKLISHKNRAFAYWFTYSHLSNEKKQELYGDKHS